MSGKSDPKQRMLETASRLFYTQGYNATGINQILEESKVAKASLYQHFGSKDQLGIAYLQSAREEWFAGLDKWTFAKHAPKQKVLACIDFLEYALRMNDFRGCKFLNMLAEIADSSPLMRQQIIEHKAKLREYIKELVIRSLPSHSPEEADLIGDSVYLLFEGAIVESKIYKDTWPVKSVKKMIKNMLGE
ncbi:AcrR family transcriptional regulator [Algoriphagus sp. 4150]|uniref:TetR/AcrR family transcriptional regulator n=1 Tax=Algoriphagus sp. 4150 TaxID=2817756 RepID=UPI00286241C1|nr:TetR/AcrR family transcriptional regulator [Algoriphagus sp. 4150]MDR7130270.1 AcrR family transcriptional regulator [Algoriphagus sp. 4150]